MNGEEAMSGFETKVTDNEEIPPEFIKTDEEVTFGPVAEEPDSAAEETEEVTPEVTKPKRGRRTKGEKVLTDRTKQEQEAGRKAVANRARRLAKQAKGK